MAITGNVGEWSEIYTLLKVLGDKNIYAGDDNLEKIENLFYPVLSVLRAEANEQLEYIIDKELVLINSNKTELLRLPVRDFADKALIALSEIKKNKENRCRTFSIPEIESFMNKIHCSSLKANSNEKKDITIKIHDQRTNNTPELGFSIKSQLGGASTLLNASKSTNFKFEILNFSESSIKQVNEINTKNKIIDRIKTIKTLGGIFKFSSLCNPIFSNNLILIDSLLPNILAESLFTYYTTSNSKLSDIVNIIENSNPLNFDKSHSHLFYSYKLKKFLTDAALGMMPSKVWTGQYEATGGYLIVKDEGELLCYHLYNRNEFEQYLFSNTRFETPSSTRHDFGNIYQEKDRFFFNLNLQIRFIK